MPGKPACGAAGAARDTITVYAGTFAQPGPTHVLRRGDPMQPGAEVVALRRSPRSGRPLVLPAGRARERAAAGPGPLDRATRRTRCRPG